MRHNAEMFNRVVTKLSETTAPKHRALPITEETEVFRDLEIYGDDIVVLLWWLDKEFGVKPTIDPFKYAPREIPFFGALMALKRLAGIQKEYKSLKVRDLVAAIDAGRWPDGDR